MRDAVLADAAAYARLDLDGPLTCAEACPACWCVGLPDGSELQLCMHDGLLHVVDAVSEARALESLGEGV